MSRKLVTELLSNKRERIVPEGKAGTASSAVPADGSQVRARCRQVPVGLVPLVVPVPKSPSFQKDQNMDAEHINQIGAQLADLAARTQALRGYL
jgi:hypothetical protein